MTFLLISHTSDLNGAERSLCDLAFGLQAKNLPVVVLCPQEGALTHRLQSQGIPVYIETLPRPQRDIVPLLKFIILWLPTVLWLAWRLKQWGITAVYNNTIDGLYGPFATRLAHVPCLWHIREVKPKQPRARTLFRWLLGWVELVVFNSQATQKAYHKPMPHWQVIYNGITLPSVPSPRELDGYLYVGYAGQMVQHKRPLDFLSAFALAYQDLPHLRAIMIGEGEQIEQIRTKIISLGLSEVVELRGYIKDTISFFSQIDMLLLPSEHEPFGRVLIEAMVAQKPVIATAVGGIPEVVVDKKTGLLVPFGKIDQYAEAILCLASDANMRAEMGRNGRQHVIKNFSLEQYQNKLIERLQWLALSS